MHHLLLVLATTPSPAPSPSLRPGLSEDQVTPGTWGFIMTAFFVVVTTLLIVDMVRRIRRVRYRGQVEEARLAAEAAGAGGTRPEPNDAGQGGAEPDDAGQGGGAAGRMESNGNATPGGR